MFSKKGSVGVPKAGVDEEKLIEIALELGADDVANDPESHEYEVKGTGGLRIVADRLSPEVEHIHVLLRRYVTLGL